MTHCYRCEVDVQPWSELDGTTGRMVDVCPRCQTPTAPSPAKAAARPSEPALRVVPASPSPTASGASYDVVALARARRDVLRAKLVEVDAIVRELETLDAMLAVVDRIERDALQADAVESEYGKRARRPRDPSPHKPH